MQIVYLKKDIFTNLGSNFRPKDFYSYFVINLFAHVDFHISIKKEYVKYQTFFFTL